MTQDGDTCQEIKSRRNLEPDYQEIVDPAIVRITYRHRLAEEQRREIERGAGFYQEFKLGLYMPQFNDDYVEAQQSIYFDKHVKDVSVHLAQYETKPINNPCEPSLGQAIDYLPAQSKQEEESDGGLDGLIGYSVAASLVSCAAAVLF